MKQENQRYLIYVITEKHIETKGNEWKEIILCLL